MYKTGVIFMTALLPTKGHQALVQFASKICEQTFVIISSRSFEPTTFSERASCFDHIKNITIVNHSDDDAPQTPENEDEWNYWKNIAEVATGKKVDVVIASEYYGVKMAELLGADFAPFDIDRGLIKAKGTNVRKNIIKSFDAIALNFQKKLQKRFVLFGQESCGKTTMTKYLNSHIDSYMTHEYARPYLEAKEDKTITDEIMKRIAYGQIALESSVPTDKAFVFHDTDILSTVGYYRIYKGAEPKWLNTQVTESHCLADLYIVMNDHIPFEEDALRYGGDKRESSKAFWIDLLDEFGCNYYVLQSGGSVLEQFEEISREVMETFFDDYAQGIRDFVREE